MANSLQEQLLKAGLTDENKVNKAKKAKQRKEKAQRHSKQKAEDESARQARLAKEAEAARDRELNRKKHEQEQHRAIQAQIKQLVELNRLPLDEGEIPYHFTDQDKVRRIHVTPELQNQLSRGRLAIIRQDDRYEIIPMGVAEKIRLRDKTCLVLINTEEPDDDGEDPYADFKVPDDLMW